MTREDVLARGREFAEAGMADACTITRTGSVTTDPVTFVVAPVLTPVYDGPCRIQMSPTGGAGSEQDLGAAHVRLVSSELQLPVATSTGVRDGDRVEVTSAVNDPDLVGRVYTVDGEAAKSEATSRRLKLKEVTG